MVGVDGYSTDVRVYVFMDTKKRNGQCQVEWYYYIHRAGNAQIYHNSKCIQKECKPTGQRPKVSERRRCQETKRKDKTQNAIGVATLSRTVILKQLLRQASPAASARPWTAS